MLRRVLVCYLIAAMVPTMAVLGDYSYKSRSMRDNQIKMLNINLLTWDSAYFVYGQRDACFTSMLLARLEDNHKLTNDQAVDFVKKLYKDKVIALVNSDDAEPDWANDNPLITLGDEGWKISSSPRPAQ